MKKTIWFVMSCLVVSLGLFGRSFADVLKVTPQEAVVLPAGEDGVTRVAVVFDLSGLRSGENRRVDEALLDWRLSGTPAEEVSQYFAYPIEGSWTPSAVENGQVPDIGESQAADWQIFPDSPVLDGCKLARLDLTELTRAWAGGSRTNYGVVIATSDLSRESLSSQLSKMTLTIRYGFGEF